MVRFGRLNLMDPSYPIDHDMDVIFCRNMLIYFDKPTQQTVLARLCEHLRPGGYSVSWAFGIPGGLWSAAKSCWTNGVSS